MIFMHKRNMFILLVMLTHSVLPQVRVNVKKIVTLASSRALINNATLPKIKAVENNGTVAACTAAAAAAIAGIWYYFRSESNAIVVERANLELTNARTTIGACTGSKNLTTALNPATLHENELFPFTSALSANASSVKHYQEFLTQHHVQLTALLTLLESRITPETHTPEQDRLKATVDGIKALLPIVQDRMSLLNLHQPYFALNNVIQIAENRYNDICDARSKNNLLSLRVLILDPEHGKPYASFPLLAYVEQLDLDIAAFDTTLSRCNKQYCATIEKANSIRSRLALFRSSIIVSDDYQKNVNEKRSFDQNKELIRIEQEKLSNDRQRLAVDQLNATNQANNIAEFTRQRQALERQTAELAEKNRLERQKLALEQQAMRLKEQAFADADAIKQRDAQAMALAAQSSGR